MLNVFICSEKHSWAQRTILQELFSTFVRKQQKLLTEEMFLAFNVQFLLFSGCVNV